jgi:hypothetical protein
MAVFLRRVAQPPQLADAAPDADIRDNDSAATFAEPWRSVDAATQELRRRIGVAARRPTARPSRPIGLPWLAR